MKITIMFQPKTDKGKNSFKFNYSNFYLPIEKFIVSNLDYFVIREI